MALAAAAIPALAELAEVALPYVASTIGPGLAKYGLKDAEEVYKAGSQIISVVKKHGPGIAKLAGNILSPKSKKSLGAHLEKGAPVEGFAKLEEAVKEEAVKEEKKLTRTKRPAPAPTPLPIVDVPPTFVPSPVTAPLPKTPSLPNPSAATVHVVGPVATPSAPHTPAPSNPHDLTQILAHGWPGTQSSFMQNSYTPNVTTPAPAPVSYNIPEAQPPVPTPPTPQVQLGYHDVLNQYHKESRHGYFPGNFETQTPRFLLEE